MRIFVALFFMAGCWLAHAPSSVASEMVEIPAGEFLPGGGAGVGHKVYLPTFRIDQNEINNEEFAGGFPDHTYPPGAGEHPVSEVTWYEAKRYCEATGKRLPTPLQWEKAASGGDGRIYPWGDKRPRKQFHPFHSGLIKRRAGIDKRDVSPHGLKGMAGSVWEWTAGEQEGKRAAHGGLWNLHLDYEYSKVHEQIHLPPEGRWPFVGFRCVRLP